MTQSSGPEFMGRFTVTGISFILWSISNQKVVGDPMTFIPLSYQGRILAVQPLLQLTGFTAVDDFPPSVACPDNLIVSYPPSTSSSALPPYSIPS